MAEEIKEVRVIDSTGKNVFDEESSTLRTITHLTASIENMATVLETMTEDFHDLSLSISNLTDEFNKLSSLLEKMAEAKSSKIKKEVRKKKRTK
jgi:regulator of replication initiation timing